MDHFAGKVVWITGASSGIGRSLALAFARAGARLILSARERRSLEPVRAACRAGSEVHLLPFDLAALESIPRVAEEALSLWGHIDYMVHNAGVALRGRMVDTPLRLDQQIMATNYFGPVALTKALLPSMLQRQSGCFVVLSSSRENTARPSSRPMRRRRTRCTAVSNRCAPRCTTGTSK